MSTRSWRKSRNFAESCGHAWQGISEAFRGERNIRIQVVAGVVALVLAFWLQLSLFAISVLVVTVALVLVLEIINTAVEHLVDILEPNYHDRAKKAKDMVAGAVMLASFAAVLVGVMLFGPPLAALLY